MNEVILHGPLGARFGESFKIAIDTPIEAFRALCAQLPGFREELRHGAYQIVREMPNGSFAVTEEALHLGMDNCKLHVLPSIDGDSSKGGIKLVLGIVLIGASLFIPGMQGFGLAAAKAAWAVKIAGTGIAFGHMALAGVALALGGAAMLIAPQPKMPSTSNGTDQKNSFIFGGPTNTSGQGFAVPLVFGQLRIGANPVATQLTTESVYNHYNDSAYTSTGNEGGDHSTLFGHIAHALIKLL